MDFEPCAKNIMNLIGYIVKWSEIILLTLDFDPRDNKSCDKLCIT